MPSRHRALSAALALLVLPACQALAPTGTAPAVPIVGATSAATPAPLGTLAGVVSDPAGKPVAGAHLLIVGHGTKAEAASGPDGAFRVELPASGAYDVVASAPDGRGHLLRAHAAGAPVVGGAPATLALRLAEPGAVAGQVLLEGAAGPEAGADAEIHVAEAPDVATNADADGRFVLAGVPDGVWTLVVQRPGFQAARRAGVIVKDGREVQLLQAVALKREAGAEVRGTVRDGGARPVPGALVTVWPATATAGQGRRHAHTDATGAFVVPGLAAGTYQIQVARRGLATTTRRDVTVPAATPLDAGAFVLSGNLAAFTVAGRVVDEAGQGVAGLEVRIPRSGAAPTRTAGDGRFEVAGVPHGDYALHVGGADHLHAGRSIHVGAAAVVLPTDLVAPTRRPLAERAVTALIPPVPTYHGGVLGWPAVPAPPGVTKVVYDVEIEEAPGQFRRVGTTEGTAIELPPAVGDRQVRVRARADGAPAGYRVAMAAMFTGSATLSGWRYGLLGAEAAPAPYVTMAHGLERVGHLVTDGLDVYALGDSGAYGPPESPLRKGALVRAGVNDRSGFTRLYSHDKELNRVVADGTGVYVLGSGQQLQVRSDGTTWGTAGVAGNPFGAEWADAIISPYIHTPNFLIWLDPRQPAYVTLRIASSYVLTTGDDDHGTISRAGTGLAALARTYLHPSSLAWLPGKVYATGEDGRYPGSKFLARYDAATGKEEAVLTDPLDLTKLGGDPSQLHSDGYGNKLYVVNRSGGREPRGMIAILDKDGNRTGTIDTPSGWLVAGMAVGHDTLTNTVWVAYNASGAAHVRKFVGGELKKTVDLPGLTIKYDHSRDASRRTIAASDAACWLYTDDNRIVRVE